MFLSVNFHDSNLMGILVHLGLADFDCLIKKIKDPFS